jgi:hypothetical protein
VQDPGEAGISGVTVQLLDDLGKVIAEVNTSSDGRYIFSSDPAGTDDVANGYDYNITQLAPNKAYTVRIPHVSGANKQSALGSNVLTVSDSGSGTDTNINDSDGIANDINAIAMVEEIDIPLSGANNHSFDFGFSPPVSLGSVIWYDRNDNSIQESNEAGIDGLTVELLDVNGNPVLDVNGAPITMITHDGGKYLFDNLCPGTYTIRVSGGTIANYVPSLEQNQNANDNNATDSNIAGGDADNGYISAPITLIPDTEPVGNAEVSQLPNNGDDQDDQRDANGNMTLDMGFTIPPSDRGTPTPPPPEPAPTPTPTPVPVSESCLCDSSSASIQSNGGDALSLWGIGMMLLMTLSMGLYFVGKEEENSVKE